MRGFKKIKPFYLISFAFSIVTIVTISLIFHYVEAKELAQMSENNENNKTDFAINSVQDTYEEEINEPIPESQTENTEGEEDSSNTDVTEDEIIVPISSANWWDYPENIEITSKSGDELSVVVNKKYQLPSTYAPTDLIQITQENTGCRVTKSLYVREIILVNLQQLCDSASSQGIDLSIISAYRSYDTQESTYQYWVNYNGGSTAAADQVSARAGHSEHQLGTTIDFSTSEIGDAIGSQFNITIAAEWLEINATNYGFKMSYPEGMEWETGYAYEGWHFRFVGE